MLLPTYFIIDGNSFLHRAYHAIPALSTKEGFPTNAITGFFNMVHNVQKQFTPDRIVVVFDAKGKNFRHDIFPDYKANRPETDEALRQQRQPIRDILEAWGIPMLVVNDVEADDSMSALGLQASDAGYSVTLVTSDKDMAQIVDDEKQICILDTKDVEGASKPKPLDSAGVKRKYGVLPSQMVDLLALMGDKVDGVPGVDGCGPKTAIKWIEEFGNVEGVIANADNITGKAGEKLRACIDILKTSKELVTIKTDIDLGRGVNEFVGTMDEDKLYELVSKYELKQFKKALGLVNKGAESTRLEMNACIFTVGEFLNSNDWENKKLHICKIPRPKFECYLITVDDSSTAYFATTDLHSLELANFARDVSRSKTCCIRGLDVKSIVKDLINLTGVRELALTKMEDPLVLDFVMHGGKKKTTPLEYLNDEFCEFNLSPKREQFKLNGKSPQWKKMDSNDIYEVASDEISVVRKTLDSMSDCEDAATLSQEIILTSILTDMEAEGVLLDTVGLKAYGEELEAKIQKVEEDMFAIAGQEFNINSPKQVAHVLFDVLGIPSKNKKTGEDALKALAADNPIINMIFECRSLTKLKSTFVDGLLSHADEDNRVHTKYNQDVTATGRLSSEQPNLQNIPVRSEDGRRIREAFIAKENHKIVALDFSQIELRILAHRAKEPSLIKAFKEGLDVHQVTASDVFKIDLNAVTDEIRRRAKAINFGLIYGLGSGALAEDLGTTKNEAKAFTADYFNTYSSIEPYFEKELADAKVNLFVETTFGRKIPTKDLNSSNPHMRSHAERATKNSGIQGTASDIIKRAMIDVYMALGDELEHMKAKMLMQVHDELVFEVPEEHAEAFAIRVKAIMENVAQLDVPLVVEFGIGKNWLEAH
ncbi:DNA polymerase I [Vibrio owensii]|uniref:DNA polymerase I n=1 Tax=Vibrio harveyi group TaxID=717610 RepID=UPI003CC69347